jgi:nitroimidazol reductase NimA-like FMN-containing flavoprotein (pyridoxamine 5'-phosphate oxidase superfamily)
MTAVTYLVDIRHDTCVDLVASSVLGRLAVIVDGKPEIFPVNHIWDRETASVMFPTNARTKLHAALSWPWVGFEVDGLEGDGSGGWSVLVVGKAIPVDDPEVIARAASQRDVLWRGGDAVRWIRIEPTKITGRRIAAADEGLTVRISSA